MGRLRKIGWRLQLVAAAAAIGVVIGATTVTASHDFPDVPNSPSSFHNAVSWLVDREITAGCGGGKFCPKSAVTREQMALFMNRLANVVSPKAAPILSQNIATDSNLDADPVVCVQDQNHVPTYEELAVVNSRVSVIGLVAPLDFVALTVYRVNNGSWLGIQPNGFTPVEITETGAEFFQSHTGRVELSPGSSYDFGVRLEPQGGSDGGAANELDQTNCAIHVLFFNGQE